MSRVVRQKHVMREMLADDFDPPKDDQQIVRVVCSRGNNLHEVEPAVDGINFLVSMPPKFRKNVWVKRGDFLLVDPIEEGDKVKAEICRILTQEHIKEFTKLGIWPKKFTKKRERDEEESDDLIWRNVNRKHFEDNMDESDEESSSSDDDNVENCN